jgi:ABC-2 type transport system ATP-binding protein
MDRPAIAVTGLAKQYGDVTALDAIDLAVRPGAVLAALGRERSGKSTLIDVLATRVRPSAGSAQVCGFDVVREARHVRQQIGVTGQLPAIDGDLSGRGNLVVIARLFGARPRQARARAAELLSVFGLDDVADRPAASYPGGLRRRLDLAAALVGTPPVLLLDEPTQGLDPVSRGLMWVVLERLAAGGTAVVLSTRDLGEAERLADQVVVLEAGRAIASGTPAQLKAKVGDRIARLTFRTEVALRLAFGALSRLGLVPRRSSSPLVFDVPLARSADVVVMVRTLDAAGAPLEDLSVAEPKLEDVYHAVHRTAGRP